MADRIRVSIEKASASGHRQGWWKHVTSVDTNQANGYAYEGEFLKDGQHDLPIGAVLIECIPTGTQRQDRKIGACWLVTADGKEQIGKDYDWKTEALSLRDLVQETLQAEEPVEAAVLDDLSVTSRAHELHALLVRIQDGHYDLPTTLQTEIEQLLSKVKPHTKETL